MRLASLALGCVMLSGCADAFTTDVQTVAHAHDYELDVERLAQIVATGKTLPLRTDAVKGVALIWVDYTLFAHSVVAGDSLLDSATVLQAKWPDVQQEIASGFHAKLMSETGRLDSTQLDSVYAAGDYRLIKQILFGVATDAPPPERAAQRERAERVRTRLREGWSWAEASRLTDEPDAAEREGSLGVITRGETVAPFEQVAFSLQPGEISDVTETAYGYHLIYRPTLDEVFPTFREGIELRLEDEFDDDYLDGLVARWEIEVRPAAATEIRELARDPVGSKESSTVIGTYRGGEFRVADAARWLQGMPSSVWQRLPGASDEQIEQMVRSLIRNEVLLLEARDAGVEIRPGTVDSLTDDLRRELARLGTVMGLPFDSLDAFRTAPAEERRELVREKPLEYIDALANNRRRMQLVPPFLADVLRDRYEWDISAAGVDRVLSRARAIRDSAGTPTPPPAPPTPAPPAPAGDSAGAEANEP